MQYKIKIEVAEGTPSFTVQECTHAPRRLRQTYYSQKLDIWEETIEADDMNQAKQKARASVTILKHEYEEPPEVH